MDNRETIQSLLAAYVKKGQMSRDTFDELITRLNALDDADFRDAVLAALDSEANVLDEDFVQRRVEQLYPQLLGKIHEIPQTPTELYGETKRTRFVWWKRSAVAAAALVMLLVGAYLWRNSVHKEESLPITADQIVAGGDRATLTLADGRTIDLNAGQRGIAVGDGIRYLDGTEVVGTTSDDEKAPFNAQLLTLTTPKGGQYQLTLPDGTRVWLNAASSLVYPEAFGDDIREVTLEGEGYFEVMKDRNRPFVVNTARQRVSVLGTSFNINAYDNENITKTTLLTGSVRIAAMDGGVMRGDERTLKPNEQGIIANHGNEIAINEIDALTAVAWKDGLFNFHGLRIDEAMKQIERWYDIRVTYNGPKPTGFLGGKMSRGVRLSTFLDFLERDFGIKSELKADRTLMLLMTKPTRDTDL